MNMTHFPIETVIVILYSLTETTTSTPRAFCLCSCMELSIKLHENIWLQEKLHDTHSWMSLGLHAELEVNSRLLQIGDHNVDKKLCRLGLHLDKSN